MNKSLIKTIACCAVSIFVSLFSLGYLQAANNSHDCPEGMVWDEVSQTCICHVLCDDSVDLDKHEARCYINSIDPIDPNNPCVWTGESEHVCTY